MRSGAIQVFGTGKGKRGVCCHESTQRPPCVVALLLLAGPAQVEMQEPPLWVPRVQPPASPLTLQCSPPLASNPAQPPPLSPLSPRSVIWAYLPFVIGLNFDFLVFSLTKHTAVIGLNFDFLVFNLTKHTAYLIFNASVFFSPLVQQQYHAKYGAEELIPVSASDVAFSVHAVALTAFTVWQCMVYNRGGQRVSWTCKAISLGVWIFALLTSLHSSFHHDWLGLVTTF
ncbi:unnamed protein product, partial [Closterium sp. Naga37s-1]